MRNRTTTLCQLGKSCSEGGEGFPPPAKGEGQKTKKVCPTLGGGIIFSQIEKKNTVRRGRWMRKEIPVRGGGDQSSVFWGVFFLGGGVFFGGFFFGGLVLRKRSLS